MADITNEMRLILAKKAWQARENAYAPYSKFKVGAAVLGTDGKIYTGCNIENVSYGLTNCGERTAIFKMVSEGCTEFVALALAGTEDASQITPCGACRQVMCEFCHSIDETEIILAGKDGQMIIETVKQLCPRPFTKFKSQE